MTTGEKLVALSSLTSGTAEEHLLHIETGGGFTSQTVLAGEFTVNLESPPELVLEWDSTEHNNTVNYSSKQLTLDKQTKELEFNTASKEIQWQQT